MGPNGPRPNARPSPTWWPGSVRPGWTSFPTASRYRGGRALIQACVAELPADDRGEHLQAGDAVRADRGRVLGQHHQVGEHAGGDRALDVLLAAGVGRTPGPGAQRLLRGDRLIRVERRAGGRAPV